MNIQGEDNTSMEEDDNVPKDMIEEDGIGAGDDGLDIPLLEKAHKPLYKGFQTTLILSIVLLVNLKVMNGLSNVAISRILRYVIFVIFNLVTITIHYINNAYMFF